MAEEGEVLLVLGRPGAGCSTLMRALANVPEPFVKIDGDVSYSSIPAHEAKKSVSALFPAFWDIADGGHDLSIDTMMARSSSTLKKTSISLC